MDWPWEIVERDHELQNPRAPRRSGYSAITMRLDGESRVLDIACGKAGPAVILASTFGCSVTGVELRAGFADEQRANRRARPRVAHRGAHSGCRELFDRAGELGCRALCLGASFVWGTMGDAAAVLVPAV